MKIRQYSEEESKIWYDYVQEFFIYNNEGNFIWKKTSKYRPDLLNTIAGYLDKKMNYYKVELKHKSFYLHRLIWLYHNKTFPILELDHIDGNTTNNRIENLREVNRNQNLQNITVTKKSKSGIKGVYFLESSKKWICDIGVNNKTIHLGTYITCQEAIDARKTAEIKYFTHNNR
jgi:hypothetical protein